MFLPGEVPWTEEPGGLQFMQSQNSDMTEWLSTAHISSWVIFTIVTFIFILIKVGNLCFRNIKPKSLSERKSTGSWNYTDQIKISKTSPWEKEWTFIYLTTNDRTGLLLTQKVPFKEFLNGTCSLIYLFPLARKKNCNRQIHNIYSQNNVPLIRALVQCTTYTYIPNVLVIEEYLAGASRRHSSYKLRRHFWHHFYCFGKF